MQRVGPLDEGRGLLTDGLMSTGAQPASSSMSAALASAHATEAAAANCVRSATWSSCCGPAEEGLGEEGLPSRSPPEAMLSEWCGRARGNVRGANRAS